MECRLIDFNYYNHRDKFVIQLFGKNVEGKTWCICAEGFKAFFYVRLPSENKGSSQSKVKEALTGISCSFELVERKKLYGFDAGKFYTFMKLSFHNTDLMNKAKRLWYDYIIDEASKWGRRRILKTNFNGEPCGPGKTKLYEGGIPPLLRFFHIQNISPSGWIEINEYKKIYRHKRSTCDYECITHYKNIIPLLNKETPIPLKICSFDIEASSSHGDFPLAKKQYEKLVMDILDAWDRQKLEYRDEQENRLRKIILTAFGMDDISDIHLLYPKRKSKIASIERYINLLFKTTIKSKITSAKGRNIQDFIDDNQGEYKKHYRSKPRKGDTIIDILNNKKYDRGDKLTDLNELFNTIFPEIEGDKVTFIGSTIRYLGSKEPYLKHCIALGKCGDVSGAEIESYADEADVLRAWTRFIQREDPDIIIGYNIFGFDFKFMLERVDELCPYDEEQYDRTHVSLKTEFLRLSRERNVKCEIKKSSLKIASGTHDLQYVAMPGRILIDLYNYFRREVNLSSYKLDNVAAHFIGDYIQEYEIKNNETIFNSKNLIGLKNGNFIKLEMIGHSIETYNGGEKFKVYDVENSTFKINKSINIDKSIKIRWCLAKDDVTPQDIFRLSNEGPSEKAIVAKYCIQDCNLVDLLLQKNDIITGFIEVASICSVPINFIVLRGQGIKLLSFIAKKCRLQDILMPDIIKSWANDGYEGAICFPPKRNLYVDDPVAVVDYASLYPSSMISENISHDSKVWTKEYDLEDNLIKETGDSLYDNRKEYEYVDVEYDTYKYLRMRAGGREIKTKVGRKICRFAQYPDGGLAVMPSILVELLAARKATRVLIKYKTVTTKDGKEYNGLITKDDKLCRIKQKNGETKTVSLDSVINIEDTYDDFMKNVFDKRQLSYKITANSLYGQCGAKTSSFYDKDIAAATTATGRKLLIYAKNIIEEVYKNCICETSLGKVIANAEVVYGDSVTNDTPLLLKNKNTGDIEFKQIDNLTNESWRPYEGFKVGQKGRSEKQQNSVSQYQIYTAEGWSDIIRVIKHKTRKKMYRVTTHTGMVDVTEDHSLLDENLNKLKPVDVRVGMSLCHNYPKFMRCETKLKDIMNFIENIHKKSLSEKRAFIWGFFYGDGSCGKYNCPSGLKYSWALNNKNYKLCSKLQCLCMDVFGVYFKINETLQSSGVYKIVPKCGNTKKYVILFRDKCYNKDKFKIIPTEFINANNNIKFAYLAGYYAADGAKCKNQPTKCISSDNKGKIGSAMLFYMFKSIGFNVSVNTRKDKRNIIRLTASGNKMRKHPHKIKKIEELGLSNNFVYDIETKIGNFNTGFPLIVKNTDSCFFTFNLKTTTGEKIIGKKALILTIEIAKEAGILATKMLKKPHDLEYEKTFWPFALLSKKRYVGMLYESDPNKCKRKSMGIVLKRRDNAPIVKDVYGGIIDILMKEQDIEKAVNFTKQFIKDMIDEKFPLSKLIISKALRGFYKNPRSIAHKVLAERIGKRDPGNKPAVGSRIPYAYIQTIGKRLQGDKIEHPEFIVKNQLKLDYSFYITNQILKPVQQIFALPAVLDNIAGFKRRKKQFYRELETLRQVYANDDEKYMKKDIAHRNKEVKRLIFEESLRKADNRRKGNQNIMQFFGQI